MRQRDPGEGRAPRCGRDTRHNFYRHTRGQQRFHFLTTAAENKGIAPFKAHDAFADLRQAYQPRIDLDLRQRVFGGFFAHVVRFRLR